MSAKTTPRTGKLARREPIQLLEADGRRDAFYLVRQWHHYFGVEYESNSLPRPPGIIAGWDESDEHYGVVAHHDDVQIGGAMAAVVTGESAENTIGPAPIDEQALAGENGAVYIYLITVDTAWRARGLGTKLLRNCLSWAREETDAETVVAHSWLRENHPSSAPLFDREGFEKIVDLPDHYAETGRGACPDCGFWETEEGRCECDAVLYAKDVERDGRPTDYTGESGGSQ